MNFSFNYYVPCRPLIDLFDKVTVNIKIKPDVVLPSPRCGKITERVHQSVTHSFITKGHEHKLKVFFFYFYLSSETSRFVKEVKRRSQIGCYVFESEDLDKVPRKYYCLRFRNKGSSSYVLRSHTVNSF